MFEKFNIDKRVLAALKDMNFTKATEIQNRVIPVAMQGNDLVAQSMTGSGKTAAFGIPMLHFIEPRRGVQVLILVPTRELAEQVGSEIKKFSKYTHMSVAKVYGGVGIEPQIHALRTAEIVVGTPGRILDHMSRRTVNFSPVKILVLDEADRMLDMGFIDDIRRIVNTLPRKRQTMLFSATISDDVMRIARNYMNNPVRITTTVRVPLHKLRQFYCDVPEEDKISLLLHLIKKEKPSLAIIFSNTKRETDFVAQALEQNGVEAKAIHGDMTQQQRLYVMEGFHRGRPHILVATDVAARGLDIKNVTHIFNYDVPNDADNYTHRIGRTARLGKEGKAITLLSKKDHESFRRIHRFLPDIEKMVEKDYPKVFVRRPQRHYGGRRHFGRRRY
ncbi:MAG: DEAD/DEAH box helicase [Candidatus Aenigmarchaeota archaeon]|nr:DEAD/DEAH box helicase [Candidatus Aenigmarchaeota archaeon]